MNRHFAEAIFNVYLFVLLRRVALALHVHELNGGVRLLEFDQMNEAKPVIITTHRFDIGGVEPLEGIMAAELEPILTVLEQMKIPQLPRYRPVSKPDPVFWKAFHEHTINRRAFPEWTQELDAATYGIGRRAFESEV